MNGANLSQPQLESQTLGVRNVGLHFILPVWGAEYVRTFLDVVLPTHLSPRNLPAAITNQGDSAYHIYTSAEDTPIIRQNPVYARLTNVLPTTIHEIDECNAAPHTVMSECYRNGIQLANAVDAATIFLTADAIFSDGAFSFLEEKLCQGTSVVYCLGLRLNLEPMSVLLRNHLDSDNAISLQPREMMMLALGNLHTWTRSSFWAQDEGLELMPSVLLWPVGDQGLLARCFHLHPIFVKPEIKNLQFNGTIDDDYVGLVCPNSDCHYTVADSDEMICLELSRSTRPCITEIRKGSIEDVSRWAVDSTSEHHRTLVETKVRLYADTVDEASWLSTEKLSDSVLSDIHRHIADRERTLYRRLRKSVKQFYNTARLILDRTMEKHKWLRVLLKFVRWCQLPIAVLYRWIKDPMVRANDGLRRVIDRLLGPAHNPSWLNWRWRPVKALQSRFDDVVNEYCSHVTVISPKPSESIVTKICIERQLTMCGIDADGGVAESSVVGDIAVEIYLDDAQYAVINVRSLEWAVEHIANASYLVLIVQHSSGPDFLKLGNAAPLSIDTSKLIPAGFDLVTCKDIGSSDHRLLVRSALYIRTTLRRQRIPIVIWLPVKVLLLPLGVVTYLGVNVMSWFVAVVNGGQPSSKDLWAKVLVLRRTVAQSESHGQRPT